MTGNEKFLIINNVVMPIPAPGYEIVSVQGVNAGRNANNQVVGQKIGRRQWKINNLQWNGLTPEEWKSIKKAIEPFYVPVTFTTDENERLTIYMYPGDATGKPLFINNMEYTKFENCKVNLIDCGWNN